MWRKLLEILKKIYQCHKIDIIGFIKELIALIITAIRNKKNKKN